MTREEFWRRYWDRIDVPSVGVTMDLPIPSSECWTWIGGTDSHGYGVVRLNRVSWLAHRLVHLVFNEELQPELWVLHSCNNTSCVNPLHLRQGVSSDNYEDVLRDYDVRPDVVHLMNR